MISLAHGGASIEMLMKTTKPKAHLMAMAQSQPCYLPHLGKSLHLSSLCYLTCNMKVGIVLTPQDYLRSK